MFSLQRLQGRVSFECRRCEIEDGILVPVPKREGFAREILVSG